MPWDPSKYNEFKDLRNRPFFDLAAMIRDRPRMSAIDLGCGTGELTSKLAEMMTDARVKGIDSSAEMLAQAQPRTGLVFERATVEEQLTKDEQFDLVFANASIQWIDDHVTLFPAIINLIRTGGQLAIQMPSQTENKLNQLLLELLKEEPWRTTLNGFVRESPVLTLDEYAQILFRNGGKELNVSQKVYPQVASSHDELYQFIAGSALVPYLERLEQPVRDAFIEAYKKRIGENFPTLPAVYAFRRILLYAVF